MTSSKKEKHIISLLQNIINNYYLSFRYKLSIAKARELIGIKNNFSKLVSDGNVVKLRVLAEC